MFITDEHVLLDILPIQPNYADRPVASIAHGCVGQTCRGLVSIALVAPARLSWGGAPDFNFCLPQHLLRGYSASGLLGGPMRLPGPRGGTAEFNRAALNR